MQSRARPTPWAANPPITYAANGIDHVSRLDLCDHGDHEDMMPTATITVDATLKARLTDLATEAGQPVDSFVAALLRRVADADIRFERGVPVFPPRPGAPILTVEDVDRLVHGDEP